MAKKDLKKDDELSQRISDFIKEKIIDVKPHLTKLDDTIKSYERRKASEIEPSLRSELRSNAKDIMRLVRADISIDDLSKFSSSAREHVYKSSSRVVELVSTQDGIDHDEPLLVHH